LNFGVILDLSDRLSFLAAANEDFGERSALNVVAGRAMKCPGSDAAD
jgi:hypothetical protein